MSHSTHRKNISYPKDLFDSNVRLSARPRQILCHGGRTDGVSSTSNEHEGGEPLLCCSGILVSTLLLLVIGDGLPGHPR